MTRLWERIGLGLLVLLLLACGYNGLVEGSHELRNNDPPWMRVATATQLLYGGAAVLALIALAFRRSWVFPLLVVWAVATTATATLAPVVYGDAPWTAGAAAGAATAVLVGLVLWGWRRACSRRDRGTEGQRDGKV